MKFKQIDIPTKILKSQKLTKIDTAKSLDLVNEIINRFKFSNTKTAVTKWKKFYKNFDQDFGIIDNNIYYPEFLIRNNSFIRANKKVFFSQNPLTNIKILNWIMINFMKKCKIQNLKNPTILELGAGYGYNLINIYKNFKNIKKLISSDFSEYSAKFTLKNFKKNNIKKFKVKVINYNNFKDFNLKEKVDIIFTRHALEQNKNCSKVIDNILKISPKIIINIEPIADFYNLNSKYDKVAYRYHQKRGYLKNYLNSLQNNKGVKILKLEKYNFGNMFNDSCGAIAWKPIQHD
jgi:SAM-dependent methyltransferase